MCGRFQFYDNKNEYIEKIIAIANQRYEQGSFDIGEIFPANRTIVLVLKGEELDPVIMKWGFTRKNAKQLTINARTDSLDRYFADDYANRRCVVCCTGFYEWDSNKKKHYISASDEKPLFLAAIYRKEEDMNHYCIITKDASEALKTVHERMPVVMDEQQAIRYLKEAPRL